MDPIIINFSELCRSGMRSAKEGSFAFRFYISLNMHIRDVYDTDYFVDKLRNFVFDGYKYFEVIPDNIDIQDIDMSHNKASIGDLLPYPSLSDKFLRMDVFEFEENVKEALFVTKKDSNTYSYVSLSKRNEKGGFLILNIKKNELKSGLLQYHNSSSSLKRIYVIRSYRLPLIDPAPINTKIIDNNLDALVHYFSGKNVPVALGPETVKAVLNNDKFRDWHYRILTNQKRENDHYFDVDIESAIFHVAGTNIEYKIHCTSDICKVTYSLFVRDGFWDVDFIDEKVFKDSGLPQFIPDQMGPNLERLGGRPYKYLQRTVHFSFPNPGYTESTEVRK